jgi:hypothetical protein
MSKIPSNAAKPLDGSEICTPLHPELPTIKILLYTDDPIEVMESLVKEWGLGRMIGHLLAHAPSFANLCIKLLSRNPDDQNHAGVKLDPEMLAEYDEVWFFGIHQVNRDNFTLGVLRGGPESELDDDEVAALNDWMKVKGFKGGGVLMTGDHAEEPPPDARLSVQSPVRSTDSGHEHFLGLGRALGYRVPRAGLLRKWEGPPTRFKEDSFNTQVFTLGTDPDDPGFQDDSVPQQLIIQHFDAYGNPAPEGDAHPLFFYKPGSIIQVFPDHAHEGAVVVPDDDELDECIWPKGNNSVQPRPRVVAYGIDKRNARLLNIVAAYDGDCVGVGRIVADSTWHHYFNTNLNRFRPPGDDGSPADQIGRYYGNLAIWLAPRKKRYKMARAMISQLATHPVILEEGGIGAQGVNDEQKLIETLKLGKSALSVVSGAASPCEIHELLNALIPADYCGIFETLHLPDKASTMSPLPSKELFLGTIVNQYRQEIAKLESSRGDAGQREKVISEVVAASFKEAANMQARWVALITSAAQSFVSLL